MKITHHGYDRLNERVGLNHKAADRLSKKALEQGIRHSDTTGALNRYLNEIFLSHGKANNMRIYGEHVYLFDRETLITVYYLDNKYKNTVRKIFKRLKFKEDQ